MEADLHPGPARGRRPRRPSLEDRLIARMLSPWLDRELADPTLATHRERMLSEAHAARAQQLVSEHTRRSLARTLDRLIERADDPVRFSPFAGIPPCCEQVHEAAPLIASLAARLRSGQPLDPQGVARLKTLVSDRTGPCYAAGRAGALAAALREASELLDVSQPREPSGDPDRRTDR